MAELVKLHSRLIEAYRNDKPEGITDYDEAALRSVATVLLNLDESLTK
jgi:hypothetical protein